LQPPGQGTQAEWRVLPAAQPDALDRKLDEYQLTFNLPEHLESWIREHEEQRASRARAVKRRFLSDIVIYRMEGESLQTFQLHYQPGELKRRLRNDG
jgi:hypothetical protein